MAREPGTCDDETRLSQTLRALHELSLQLSLQKHPDELCHLAVSWALANLGFDRVSLWLIDPADSTWSLGTWGTDESGKIRDERGARVRRDPYIAPPEFYEGKIPVLTYRDQVCYDEKRQVVGHADKALAPLWDGSLIIGEFSADNFLSQRAIEDNHLEPLIILARLVAHHYTLLETRRELARVSDSRGVLLKEIKHRTRNNLNIVAGLVALESFEAEGDEARQKLGSLRDRIDALGSLYTLLDTEADGSPVSLNEYVETVARRLTLAHGADARGIALALDLHPVLIDGRQAAPVGIALNELLTDCLKYGFAQGRGGTLAVSLSQHGSEITLQVKDDGPGLPADLNVTNHSGMGLGLVSALARQLGGEMTCFNDGGAVFRIGFPADHGSSIAP